MPKGAYTQKQERKADHIMEGYRKEGVSKKEAEERAWRTVNKQDKGGKNDGSGRSSSRSAVGLMKASRPSPSTVSTPERMLRRMSSASSRTRCSSVARVSCSIPASRSFAA